MPLDIIGAWDYAEQLLEIRIFLPPTFNKQDLSALYSEIVFKLTHELAHVEQTVKNRPSVEKAIQKQVDQEKERTTLQSPIRGPDSKSQELLNTFAQFIKQREQYMSSQIEIEAFAIGFYKLAVQQKRPFMEILDEQLSRQINYQGEATETVREGATDIFMDYPELIDAVMESWVNSQKKLYFETREKIIEYVKQRFPKLKGTI